MAQGSIDRHAEQIRRRATQRHELRALRVAANELQKQILGLGGIRASAGHAGAIRDRVALLSRSEFALRHSAEALLANAANYRAPITSCNCAVFANCWKLASLPSRIFQMWQIWVSSDLPVVLCFPV